MLRCGNPQSFTLSKLLRLFLARLVFLGCKSLIIFSYYTVREALLLAAHLLVVLTFLLGHLRRVNSLRKSRALRDLLASAILIVILSQRFGYNCNKLRFS